MKANQAAFDLGQLTERMAWGYFAHSAALFVAANPLSQVLAPQTLPGHEVPIGFVKKKDGSEHAFHFLHALKTAATDPELAEDLPRVWLAGTLLKIGDALSLHNYFDRAPELELLRHLRNGVAHGNRFRIDKPASLARFPAHNRLAWVRGKAEFEISECLQGQGVLFEFMGPGDVLDLLQSVGVYLVRMGNGDPLRR